MGEKVKALRQITLNIGKGEFFVILGASGSGKTTLLNIIGGLDFPEKGEVVIEGKSLTQMTDREITLFRRRKVHR